LNHSGTVLAHNGSRAAGVIKGALVVEVVRAFVVVAAAGAFAGAGEEE
jgi:hypothetical protein